MSLPERFNKVLLNAYKRRKQTNNDLSLEHCIQVIRATVSRTKYCFLITSGQEGSPTARLVEPLAELNDFIFFIGTHPASRKVRQISESKAVTLAFSNADEDANLVVYGTASISDAPEIKQQYWKSTWRLFFPEGPEGDDYVVIRVQAEKMEILNFQRNVIPEPFGLQSVVLERTSPGWTISPPADAAHRD